MKKLYLIAKNHMDPSWRRCFTDHFSESESGKVVRPYADIEEMLILEYMDLAEKYGVKYEIEQSLVVKKFLERNPDQFERFKKLVGEGLLELAGGGETVIDYNLTKGESWVRNHLYSLKYYAEKFGHKPRYAITPDIFGLPAQLPQFFRSIGYDADILFDRVFKENKPFWRGLDGTDIVLDQKWLQPPQPCLRTADTVQLKCCPVCDGNGCEACRGSGLDISYSMTRPDKELLQGAYYGNMTADGLIEKLLMEDKDEYYVLITTEEAPIGDHLFGSLKEAGLKRGVEVEYLSFEENHDMWCKGQVERLRKGDYGDDEIDERTEGNPMCTGYCSSRIEIKKANRELEQLLFEAENLAVIALLNGGWDKDSIPRRDYPMKKLETLWNKMAFIQFHDCVTGTHCDASYNELLRYIREVRRGAEQIYHDASSELLRLMKVDIPDGFNAAVFFNPTDRTIKYPKLLLRAPVGTVSVDVYDSDMKKADTFEISAVRGVADAYIRTTVRSDVPPFSCKVFYGKTAEKSDVISCGEKEIENEYYKVISDGKRIVGVFDKTAGKDIVSDGGLTMTRDNGSPWGRNEPEGESVFVNADLIKCVKEKGCSKLILGGKICENECGDATEWSFTVTLYDGEKLVRCDTDINWQGDTTRVYASFMPSFSHDGDIYCEIPFGMIKRGSAEKVETPGVFDDWPSIGYAGVSGENMNLAILKGGFPGTSVKNGALRVAVLRAMVCGDPNDKNNYYKNTNDRGRHQASFALASFEGDFENAGFSHAAETFNSIGHTECLKRPSNGKLLPGRLLDLFKAVPENISLSALKLSEDGKDVVVRFWENAGKTAEIKTKDGVELLRCDSLEEEKSDSAVSCYSFRPFEIAAFRVKKSQRA
ncbi:MAG: hypothetical protein K6F09_03185 [Clostridiales bacterium]|nr:hypothetical protein [Clostridiales bacterium]